jgi:hypothetical protein
MRSEGIRIGDLAAPQLNEAALGLLGSVTEDMVVLEPGGILEAARAQAGLQDFGDMDFVQRLTLACDAYKADADLTTMGRITASTVLIRAAVQRLRHEALWRQSPEIAEVDIKQPIVIAGLPRTGTTHLLNLISADKRLRSLQYWESLEPFTDLGEQAQAGEEDPRWQRCRDEFAFRDAIMPYFKNMHEMLPEHIHEEAELQMLDYSTQFIETLGVVPAWRDDYLRRDQTPHYRYMKRVQQALQWLRGPDRWIMKSPQHVEQLLPLHAVFPDATFVVTHRDPVAVATSLITMMVYTARIGRNPVKPGEIARYWADRIGRMLDACVRDIDTLPPQQTVHVHFTDFMANDMAAIERIYARADHPLTACVRTAMQSYVRDNPRGKHGQILYDLEGDFGISPQELYERYKPYTDKFDVALECS